MLSFLPSTRHPERSEGSWFKTIVNQLSLNTGRQEGAAAGGSPPLVPAVPPFPPQAVGQQCLTTLSFLPSTVIRGRSADNRKVPLNFSFPLEGKCHEVAKGCTRLRITMLLHCCSTQGQLRLTWKPSAGSPQSEGSWFKTIVNQLSLNTGQQEAASSPWCLTAPPSPTDGKTIEHSNAKSLISTDFRLI